MDTKAEAQVAGMTPSGRPWMLERPVSESAWVIPADPSIEERDDGAVLRWAPPTDQPVRVIKDYGEGVRLVETRPAPRPRVVGDDSGILEGFYKLAEGPAGEAPVRVLRFAKKYGPLWLCEAHGMPRCSLDEACSIGSERISDWLMWALMARSALRITAHLHREKSPDPEDWDVLLGSLHRRIGYDPTWLPLLGDYPADLTVEDTKEWLQRRTPQQLRRELGVWVNGWCEMGRMEGRLSWDQPEVRIQLAAKDAFGAIGRQLLFSVARVDGFAVCCNCGHPFVPGHRRRPRGKLTWCDHEECQRAGHAFRQRRVYSKRKKKRAFDAQE